MSGVDAMIAWLREQHDADEKAALAASDGPWTHTASIADHKVTTRSGDAVAAVSFVSSWDGAVGIEAEDAEHIARHDPADTLARIEAERRVLELHGPLRRRSTSGLGDDGIVVCRMCDQFPAQYPCATVRALASGYRHRPGWQEGWAP